MTWPDSRSRRFPFFSRTRRCRWKAAMRRDVPLAPLTTLGIGGPAKFFVEAHNAKDVVEATSRDQPLLILAGGSNVLIADEGFPGLVVHLQLRGMTVDGGRITAAAGEPWDAIVAQAVAKNWAGIECLSGIPGSVGATPIQNVGAYGQDVSETIVSVRVYDRREQSVAEMAAADCGFTYRSSVLKRTPGRWVVLAVRYELDPQPRSRPIAYAE